MTLRKYIEELVKFSKENPETLDMQVITSIDDEGNGFFPVQFGATKGIYQDGVFIFSDDYEEYNRKDDETNAVCVN